jgi:hypothetical protein
LDPAAPGSPGEVVAPPAGILSGLEGGLG